MTLQVGSIIVYDAVEKQILRKIGAGWHDVECVTFDHDYNFTITTDKPNEKHVAKYSLKGDLVSSDIVCSIVRVHDGVFKELDTTCNSLLRLFY